MIIFKLETPYPWVHTNVEPFMACYEILLYEILGSQLEKYFSILLGKPSI